MSYKLKIWLCLATAEGCAWSWHTAASSEAAPAPHASQVYSSDALGSRATGLCRLASFLQKVRTTSFSCDRKKDRKSSLYNGNRISAYIAI